MKLIIVFLEKSYWLLSKTKERQEWRHRFNLRYFVLVELNLLDLFIVDRMPWWGTRDLTDLHGYSRLRNRDTGGPVRLWRSSHQEMVLRPLNLLHVHRLVPNLLLVSRTRDVGLCGLKSLLLRFVHDTRKRNGCYWFQVLVEFLVLEVVWLVEPMQPLELGHGR